MSVVVPFEGESICRRRGFFDEILRIQVSPIKKSQFRHRGLFHELLRISLQLNNLSTYRLLCPDEIYGFSASVGNLGLEWMPF